MWTQTYSGLAFDLENIDQRKIKIIDIAHSLSLQCRYNGHCKTFYSVAEHCYRMSIWDLPGDPLARLMHDAAEAYIGDIVRPMKEMLGDDIKIIEGQIQRAINDKYRITYSTIEIKKADEIMLATEKRDLMAPCEKEWYKLPKPYSKEINPLDSKYAENLFLKQFISLV